MKIRSNYVSNSSSSSFILDKKEDICYFENKLFNKKQAIFYTNELKELIIFFIKDFTKNYNIQEEYSLDEIWDKYFEGKVPGYFKYNYIYDWSVLEWNFSELKDLLRHLPDDKWLTDSYDRDWAYEHLPHFIKEFDGDL
jgi:hypothetical protein